MEIKVGRDRTTIRCMRADDMTNVLDHIVTGVKELPHYKGVRIDRDRVEFLLKQQLTSKDESAFWIRLLVNEKDEPIGGAAAYCVTLLLSWEKMCNDVFLYVAPEWRTLGNVMKIINAYKKWALARKPAIIGASHTGGYKREAMDRLLNGAGFREVGTLYYLDQGEMK
jgi:hypothetical protein